MRYMGGKSRLAGPIAAYINAVRQPGQSYWEPFVGAGWVLARVRGSGPVYASDNNPYLIELWRALQRGWVPPERVTEAEHRKAREGYMTMALTAFIGFGCSFGGTWFGGYARDRQGRNYARQSSASLQRKLAAIAPDAHFFFC